MRQGVPRKLRLKVKELGVLVEETTVSRVRREPTPLVVADKEGERYPLAFPALAVSDGMFLRLFLFVTVATKRTGVR